MWAISWTTPPLERMSHCIYIKQEGCSVDILWNNHQLQKIKLNIVKKHVSCSCSYSCFFRWISYGKFEYLAARVFISKEIEDSLGWNMEPEGSCSTEDNTRRSSRVVDALSSHDSNIVCTRTRQSGPCVSCGGAHSSTKAYHHSLSQLQHALSSFLIRYH